MPSAAAQQLSTTRNVVRRRSVHIILLLLGIHECDGFAVLPVSRSVELLGNNTLYVYNLSGFNYGILLSIF